MKTLILFIIFINLIFIDNIQAERCTGGSGDSCIGFRCDEYVKLTMSDKYYPYDSYWDAEESKAVCPSGGCLECGRDGDGEKTDDCYSPFNILSQLKTGKFPITVKTKLNYY